MATTFIDYKDDKGFWIAEIYMELTFEYINQALSNTKDEIPFRDDLLFEHEFFSNGYSKGILTLLWNSFLQYDKDNEQIMIGLVEETKQLVASKGKHISTKELNSYEEKKESNVVWHKPLKTSEIIKILDALILMLKDQWDETSYDMKIDYSFV